MRCTIAALAVMLIPGAALAQDGGALFQQRCQVCHVTTGGAQPTIGPNLAGVAGRKAGSTSYDYSARMKASGLIWNKTTLDKFLAGPSKLLPGTKMMTSVPDAKQRAAIIAYLAGLR